MTRMRTQTKMQTDAVAQARQPVRLKVKVEDMEKSFIVGQAMDAAKRRFGRIPKEFEGFCTISAKDNRTSYNYEKGFEFLRKNGLLTPQGQLNTEGFSGYLDEIASAGKKSIKDLVMPYGPSNLV